MNQHNEVSVSRAALLELRRERELIEQGYRFLDEKRMQLAREMLHRLASWESVVDELGLAESNAREVLVEAVTAHGVADLATYPAATAASVDWSVGESHFLGLGLPVASLSIVLSGTREPAAIPRPLAVSVADHYARIVEIAAESAAMITSLLRLEAEYKRTERSVRALENVVMPEIREQEKSTEEELAELEQEEAVRVRLFARSGGNKY